MRLALVVYIILIGTALTLFALAKLMPLIGDGPAYLVGDLLLQLSEVLICVCVPVGLIGGTIAVVRRVLRTQHNQ